MKFLVEISDKVCKKVEKGQLDFTVRELGWAKQDAATMDIIISEILKQEIERDTSLEVDVKVTRA